MEFAHTTGKWIGICKEFVPSCHVKFVLALAFKCCFFLAFSLSVHISTVLHLFFFFFPKLIAAFMLPSREALCLGERVITYLPRCADLNSEVRKFSAQVIILNIFFVICFLIFSQI